MSSHTCLPDHPGILADDCERCAEHAESAMLLDLDGDKTRALWDKMVAVEFGDGGGYETGNEAKACRTLYLAGIWLERNLGIRPWVPWDDLRRVGAAQYLGVTGRVEIRPSDHDIPDYVTVALMYAPARPDGVGVDQYTADVKIPGN